MSIPIPSRDEVERSIQADGIAVAGQKYGVAAILYTYCCTIPCRHCCFGCAAARPNVRMAREAFVRNLAALHELGRVIHVAGGECMMFWDDLRPALAAAQQAGVAPHFVESNCSFATSDAIVRGRLEELASLGVRGMLFSADPYHQQHVPPENFCRARRIAWDIFGRPNVWAMGAPDEQVHALAGVADDPVRLREHVRAHPPMMVGTAFSELRRFLDDYPLAEMPLTGGWRGPRNARDCEAEFDEAKIWEIHLDPYDNIQTNCGVILGKASEVAPRELVERGITRANWIVELLCQDGPFALAEFAAGEHGYAIPDRCQSKCALCYRVRSFLRPHYPDLLGPAEVYAAGG